MRISSSQLLLDEALARDDFPDEDPLLDDPLLDDPLLDEDPRERLQELFDELELLRLDDELLAPDDDPRLRLDVLFDFDFDEPSELPRLLLPEDAPLRPPRRRFGEALSDFDEPFELDFVVERRRVRGCSSSSSSASASAGSSSSSSSCGSSSSSSSYSASPSGSSR